MTAALGASLIARWLAHPLYGALASAQRLRLTNSTNANETTKRHQDMRQSVHSGS
jgi:hypothetical protein